MSQPAPFRFASLAMTVLVIAMTMFGHLYAKARHDHGAWVAASGSVPAAGMVAALDRPLDVAFAAAAVVASDPQAAFGAAPNGAEGIGDPGACGCCFSGCGCCSTALWPVWANYAPPASAVVLAARRLTSEMAAGLSPAGLDRPSRLRV